LPVLPLLQDLLVPAGQTLADCTAKDATQVEQLTAAAAAARADAIVAITGQPVAADAAASRRVAGKQQGVSVSGGGEIEPTESGTITKSLAGVPERCRVWCAGVHSVVVSSRAPNCMLLSRAWQPSPCACASLLDGWSWQVWQQCYSAGRKSFSVDGIYKRRHVRVCEYTGFRQVLAKHHA
jgi:hypothetical protein